MRNEYFGKFKLKTDNWNLFIGNDKGFICGKSSTVRNRAEITKSFFYETTYSIDGMEIIIAGF